MPTIESITLSIPRGSLGVDIEPSEHGVLVAGRRAGFDRDSPLRVGDVITSGEWHFLYEEQCEMSNKLPLIELSETSLISPTRKQSTGCSSPPSPGASTPALT